MEMIENTDAVIAKFNDRAEGVLHEGDTLTFLFHSDAVEANLTTMINAPLEKQGRDGPWLGQVIVPDSDKLLMSYAFTENDENGWEKLKYYRGPQAPALPLATLPIRGKHIKHRLFSKQLGEHRMIEVYVPDVESHENLPVVYMTDGGAIDRYVGPIEWKIQTGVIQPIILVGIHSGGYVGNRDKVQQLQFDYRAKEYLSGIGDERYRKHCLFVRDEVMPFIERTYGASGERSKRVLSGYSNGGACVLTLSVDYPELFANVFPYSVAFFSRDDLRENIQDKTDVLPNYRFAAGTLEHFIKGTQESYDILKQAGINAEMRSYVAGHDPLLWLIALLDDLEAVFPGKPIANVESKSPFWNSKRRTEYSQRKLDSSKWNMEMFRQDLEALQKYSWPTKAALSGIPTPVPEYPNFGGALMNPTMKIGDQEIRGTTLAWGKYDVNQHLFQNETDDLLVYLNIFVLTDMPDPKNCKKAMVSRNWPHILSTGKQKTSIGDVDWVQVGFADDNNYAFINQQIFDLKFGNTIIVAPQKDGSLQFLQLDGPASIESRKMVQSIEAFTAKLAADERVLKFVNSHGVLGR